MNNKEGNLLVCFLNFIFRDPCYHLSMNNLKKISWGKLIASIAICEGVGILGSIFTASSVSTWYRTLEKPYLSPPSWVFAPVWTLLFFAMGIALYLVWTDKKAKRKEKVERIIIFSAQLLMNLYWSVLFFGLRNPGAAFVQIVILWFSILATIIAFHSISKKAAYLLIPYLLWVGFATYLNWGFWQNNKQSVIRLQCTLEAKLCPDGSTVGRTAPNCAFAPCPIKKTPTLETQKTLPTGYTLTRYSVEKILENTSCTKSSDCTTPPEYSIQSRCPFTAICLQQTCTVVCPERE